MLRRTTSSNTQLVLDDVVVADQNITTEQKTTKSQDQAPLKSSKSSNKCGHIKFMLINHVNQYLWL